MRYAIKEMEYGASITLQAKNMRELRKEIKKWGWKSYSIKKLNKTNKTQPPG